jgi:hypothetical protein
LVFKIKEIKTRLYYLILGPDTYDINPNNIFGNSLSTDNNDSNFTNLPLVSQNPFPVNSPSADNTLPLTDTPLANTYIPPFEHPDSTSHLNTNDEPNLNSLLPDDVLDLGNYLHLIVRSVRYTPFWILVCPHVFNYQSFLTYHVQYICHFCLHLSLMMIM